MFDVYLNDNRAQLLVVAKGPYPREIRAVAKEESGRHSKRRNQDGHTEKRLLFAQTTKA